MIEAKEAIERIKEHIEIHYAKEPRAIYISESLYMAIDALKKQTPQNPKFCDTKFRQRGSKYGECVTIEKAYNCPKCNCTVWETDRFEHCNHCGQALDWS